MLPERIIKILEKQQNGDCTPEELAELNDWYDQFGDQEEAVLDRLDQNPELMADLKSDILASVNAETGLEHYAAPVAENRPLYWGGWIKYAAAACAALILVTWGLTRKPVSVRNNNEIVVTTKKNETLKVVLPDSSWIWLKPESSVRYLVTLGKSTARELTFTGEGFFQITHNEAKPFVVHTSDIDIKVLGTTFNVRSYAGDSLVETALVTGKVRIESPSRPLVKPIDLTPNQTATFNKPKQILNLYSTRAGQQLTRIEPAGAKQIQMTFDERPFAEVLSQMEKKFGVEIYMDDDVAQKCRFTADLEKEGLDDILSMLRLTHGVSYARYKNEVFLHGKICDN